MFENLGVSQMIGGGLMGAGLLGYGLYWLYQRVASRGGGSAPVMIVRLYLMLRYARQTKNEKLQHCLKEALTELIAADGPEVEEPAA